MQNPITFLAPQPTANISPQAKSSTNSNETAPSSFKQVLSKEISEKQNTSKEKSTNEAGNKTIPQDSQKNISSQPTKIEPIAEDKEKNDVIPAENDQTNGVQLIALVESLTQFSQVNSNKPIEPTKSEIPAIASNTFVSLTAQATEKIPLGQLIATDPLQKNDLPLLDAAPISASTGKNLPLDLKVDSKVALKSDNKVAPTIDLKVALKGDNIVAPTVDPKVALKNDDIVAPTLDPKLALKRDNIVTPTTDPKVALKSEMLVANDTDPRTTLNDDVKTVFKLDPKTSLKDDLKVASSPVPTINPKVELQTTSLAELKTSSMPELKTDVKTNTQLEKNEDFKIDVKQDFKKDLKIDTKSNLKTDLKIQETTNLKEQSLKVSESTPAAQNFSQQFAVSSAQLNATNEVAHLAPRLGSTAWNQSLGQKIVWMVAGGQQTAELTLNPPDLGPMQVVLSVNNDQANATFISAHPDVRDALESAMPKLRQMMSDAGVQLSGFSVKSESSNTGAQFTGDRSSSRSKSDTTSAVSGTNASTATTSTIKRSSGSGIVDTFA